MLTWTNLDIYSFKIYLNISVFNVNMSPHHNRPHKHVMYSKSFTHDPTYTLLIKNLMKINDNNL